jgi:hypothetical protein
MARHSTDRDRTRRDKQHLAQPVAGDPSSTIHYGRKFAETETKLHARARPHPAEAPTAADGHLGSTDAQVSPTPAHPSSGAAASETGRGPGSSAPARPGSEPAPLGAGTMLLAFGADSIEAFQRLGAAVRAVALLPVRGVRLLSRLGRTWLRGSPGRA